MTTKHYVRFSEEVDKTFFDNEDFWEASKIDGKTKEDLVDTTYGNAHFFIITTVDGKEVCMTACEHLSDDKVEVHTFVLPEYRGRADVFLGTHLYLLKDNGYTQIYTACSSRNMAVKNFLQKRLGFKTYGQFTSGLVKVDGKMLTVYRMVRLF